MNIKKTLVAAALIASCSVRAGIPVTVDADLTAIQNQIVNYAQMLKEYATMIKQLDEMRRQFSQMEKEYASITGSRNLGEILNDPQFRQYLPEDWQDVYSTVRGNGYGGLSQSARGIRDTTKIFDSCSNQSTETEKTICDARAVKPAQDQAFAIDAYKKSQGRVVQIEGLMREINRTRDPKAVSEINARIQAEQALIQNEQTKISLYKATSEAEERLLIQQEEEANRKRLASRNYGNFVPPMEF
ncbi:P-type DNA transfer protein VirB5 [Vibrio rotiferianus]|uniref:P-type DNA transfer protein VirB5 n=1 Tax=Vibrio rotiferianus TaxID=190895 RepID=UPI000AFEFF64|nr:P-type DNA transfer protein VirB5 [Vibrio rotiferianus]